MERFGVQKTMTYNFKEHESGYPNETKLGNIPQIQQELHYICDKLYIISLIKFGNWNN